MPFAYVVYYSLILKRAYRALNAIINTVGATHESPAMRRIAMVSERHRYSHVMLTAGKHLAAGRHGDRPLHIASDETHRPIVSHRSQ